MQLFSPLFLVLGVALQALAASMLVAAIVGAGFNSGNAPEFAYSALTCVLGGLGFFLVGKLHQSHHLLTRQMFLVTGGTWLILPLFASMPFYFGSGQLSITDAVFESVSGLTTTGSTVINGLDHQAPDVLLWRSLLQWQGGVGIICMAVALLPFLQVGGMRLFQTESSHWSDDNVPRARQLVASILRIYLLLTVLCTLAYVVTGMSLFDAVNHALCTISTGGYSTSDRSFMQASIASQWAGVLFMLSGSLPFVLYLQLKPGHLHKFIGNSQIRTLLLILALLCLAVGIQHYLTSTDGLLRALTLASFNLTSIVTTTGFASVDYSGWGGFTIAVVFFATFIGGCSGSTSGGTKIFRLQVFARLVRLQLLRTVHPRITRVLSYNGKQVKDEVITALVSYFFVMIMCLASITAGLALCGLDLTTSITGAATALMNVGPGLGDVIGPAGNFASLPAAAKWLLAAGMLLGRLEFLTILILFTPSFWRG